MSKYNALLVLITLGWLNIGQSAYKKDNCLHKRNKICQQIIKLNKTLSNEDAYSLSNTFSKISKKYDLDPSLLVSIAYQESAFKLNAVRKVKGLILDEKSGEYKTLAVGSDFCMMQIHTSNIKKMNLSVDKLLKNRSYCIEAGAKILAKYKNLSAKTDKLWWTLYNAKSDAKRAIYHEKVGRHLSKLNYRSKRSVASEK